MNTQRNALAAATLSTRPTALAAALAAALGIAVAGPALADGCAAPAAGMPEVCTVLNVPYVAESDSPRQTLDIYYRPDRPDAKVVMFVPGGAWKQGDKEAYHAVAESLTGHHGLTTVVVNYRVSDDSEDRVQHPGHVLDVAAAFGYVKRNIAAYGDPEQTYLFGQSAGAHLVSLLATDPVYLRRQTCDADTGRRCAVSDIRAVVSMSGAYDLPAMTTGYAEPGLGGLQAAMTREMYRQTLANGFGDNRRTWISASPMRHINPDQPPFLLLYSFDDLPGFAEQAHRFSVAVNDMLLAAEEADTAAARAIDDPMGELNELPMPFPGGLDPVTSTDPADATAPPRPAPRTVELRRIERIDYSAEVWSEALCLSGSEAPSNGEPCDATEPPGAGALFAGHYAEVITINPNEPWSEATRLVVDFIASH